MGEPLVNPLVQVRGTRVNDNADPLCAKASHDAAHNSISLACQSPEQQASAAGHPCLDVRPPPPPKPKSQRTMDSTGEGRRFSHGSIPEPNEYLGMFIEVFAGKGGLSSAAQDQGFAVLAFDRESKSPFPIQTLDLTDPEQEEILMTIIKEHHRSIRHIHAAPPCGTCSAAREKPIPAFERLGFPSPRP